MIRFFTLWISGGIFSGLPPGWLPRRDSLCTLEPSPFVRYTALGSAASFRTNFPSQRFSVEMNIKISSEILQISPLNCIFYGHSSKYENSVLFINLKGETLEVILPTIQGAAPLEFLWHQIIGNLQTRYHTMLLQQNTYLTILLQ